MPRAARRGLTRDGVLGAAIRLADAEGIGAVTMRRLASELGVEAMSLYHHLPGKDSLLDGLVEAVLTEVREEIDADTGPEPDGADWRHPVRRRCLAARRVMLRHPWAPGLVTSRSTIPAGAFGLFDDVLGAMIHGGCSYALGHRAMHALGSMTLGFAQELFSPTGSGGSLDVETTAADLTTMAAQMPHLTAMAAAEFHPATDPTLGWCDSQAEFEFTLDLLLDGLERARAGDVRP